MVCALDTVEVTAEAEKGTEKAYREMFDCRWPCACIDRVTQTGRLGEWHFTPLGFWENGRHEFQGRYLAWSAGGGMCAKA